MPCRSDYLGANGFERGCQNAAINYVYALKALALPRDKRAEEISKDYYGGSQSFGHAGPDDYCVSLLCALLKKLSQKDLDSVVYDGRNKKARALADWWDEHKKADRERLSRERKERREEKLKEQALGKLTKAEKEALRVWR